MPLAVGEAHSRIGRRAEGSRSAWSTKLRLKKKRETLKGIAWVWIPAAAFNCVILNSLSPL